MEFLLQREKSGEAGTIGKLYGPDGDVVAFTLEDAVPVGQWDDKLTATEVAALKVPEQTAIPAGRYEMALTWSKRFGRVLPLLLDVPGFTGIRVHAGNTIEDTSGCILVGQGRAVEWVEGKLTLKSSRAAERAVTSLVRKAMGKGKVWVQVRNAARLDVTLQGQGPLHAMNSLEA